MNSQEPKVVTDAEETKRWYLGDKLHRMDGPAVEFADGTKAWYQNDKLHRIDGPAIEYTSGTKSWWLNDKLSHIEYADGRVVRYLYNKRPRSKSNG